MKKVYRASEEAAWELLRQEPYLDVAGVGPEGRPILRTFNSVVHAGALMFHCGVTGEKMSLFGQPVTVQARRPLTVVPSYFVDPVMACPATAYFLSAQASGVLTAVTEPSDKAACLAALMARHQPEGGHAPIAADDPTYARALESVTVGRLVPEQVVAKHKFGQNRSGDAMLGVIDGLWRRGAPGDLEAIRLICERHPARPCPPRWQPLPEVRLCVRPDATDARDLTPLLLKEYWWQEAGPDAARVVVEAHLGSPAWLVARHAQHGVIGSIRAHGDGARHAFVMDTVVHPRFRGRGLGRALLDALLDHPRLRRVQKVELRTRDAQGLYASRGFQVRSSPFDTMLRSRKDVSSRSVAPA